MVVNVTHRVISPGMFIGTEDADVISFGSGQPDLAPPFDVSKVFLNFSKFKYGKICGEDELKNKLRGYVKREFGYDVSEECIAVTNGASEALDLALRMVSLRHDRKRVLLTKPCYYSYPHLARINHMMPVYTDAKINLEDVKEKSRNCDVMIVNSPANPTGDVIEKSVLRGIQEITEDNGCLLISDEVYHSLTYRGKHYSPKGDNVVTINSFSKTYSLCGYRIGYVFCQDMEFIRDICDIKAHTSMNTNLLSQRVAMECLCAPKKHVVRNREIFQRRRDYIYRRVKESGFEVEKPEGAFYILPKTGDSMRMARDLFFDHKVIVYPGEWFGCPGHIRLSFALPIDKIGEGMERICEYVAKL